MGKHPEDELIDCLRRLVAMWRTAQRNDGKSRPLIGSLDLHDLGADVYLVKSMVTSPARVPTRPIRFPMSAIETLIYLRYLHPTEGPRGVTYLHPTTDAFFLVDVSTHEAFRSVFHCRYERLRTSRP